MDCYDEMHNHVLTYESRIMPFPKKALYRPQFKTPKFFVFQNITAADADDFKRIVLQLARERCFELKLPIDPENPDQNSSL